MDLASIVPTVQMNKFIKLSGLKRKMQNNLQKELELTYSAV